MPSKDRKKAAEKKTYDQDRRAGPSSSSTAASNVPASVLFGPISTSSTPADKGGRPAGGSQANIQRMSAGEKSVEARQQVKQEEEICRICEEVIEDDALVLLCNHPFHPYCLIERFVENKNSNCPICDELAHVCVGCKKNIQRTWRKLECGHFLHQTEYTRLIKSSVWPKCPACDKTHKKFCANCHTDKGDDDGFVKLDCHHRIHRSELTEDFFCKLCKKGPSDKCYFCEDTLGYGEWYVKCHCELDCHAGELRDWLNEHEGKCPICRRVHPNFCFVCGNLFRLKERKRAIHLVCCDTKYHAEHLATWFEENGRVCPQCKIEIGDNYRPVQRGGGGALDINRIFCDICGTYNYDPRDQIQVDCCRKHYHYKCIEEWSKNEGGKCPECSTVLSTEICPQPERAQRCSKCSILHGAKFIHQYDDKAYCLACLKRKMEKDVHFEFCNFCHEQVYDVEKMSHAEINEAKKGKHLGYCNSCSWKKKIGFFFNGDECQCKICPPKKCKKLFRRTDWTKQICVQCNTAMGDDSHMIMLMCGDIFHKKCYLEFRKKGRVICPKCEYEPDYCMHCDLPAAIFDSDQSFYCNPSITMGCCKKIYNAMHLYNALGGCLAYNIKCPNCQKELPFKADELRDEIFSWQKSDPHFYLGNLVLNPKNSDTFQNRRRIGESLYKNKEKWDDLCIINENRALVNGIDINMYCKNYHKSLGDGQICERCGLK